MNANKINKQKRTVSRTNHKKLRLFYPHPIMISLAQAWIWATTDACASPLRESKARYNWESSA